MGVGGHVPLPAARRVGASVLLGGGWTVHVDLLSPSCTLLFGVGRADCRALDDNAITELAATLFDKLTNLEWLYVTLNAAMHAPFRS